MVNFRCPACFALDDMIRVEEGETPGTYDRICDECNRRAHEGISKVRPNTSVLHGTRWYSYERKCEWARKNTPDELKAFNLVKYGPMP